MPEAPRRVLVIFGTVFVGVGLAIALGAAWLLERAAAPAEWPTTAGLVITSEVASGTDTDGTRLYWPNVEYRYGVNDSTYVGTRVRAILTRTSSDGPARRVVARYPAGAAVTVFYDPADPSSALLDTDTGAIVGILFAAAGACVLIGGAALLAHRRALERGPA